MLPVIKGEGRVAPVAYGWSHLHQSRPITDGIDAGRGRPSPLNNAVLSLHNFRNAGYPTTPTLDGSLGRWRRRRRRRAIDILRELRAWSR